MSIPEFPSSLWAYQYASSAVPTFLGTFSGRVVPTPYVGSKPVSAAFVTQHSHWVDCEAGIIIPYGYRHPAGVVTTLGVDWDEDEAGVIIWCRPDSEAWILLVLWTEIRYADTPDEYRRYWCQRVRPDNILFEHPC